MITNWNWPSREEWAKQVRTVYSGMDNHIGVSDQLADWGTPEEIAEVVSELQVEYRALGQTMRAARNDNCRQRPGENKRAYFERWLALPEEEQARVSVYDDARERRIQIKEMLAAVANGQVPSRRPLCADGLASLAPIEKRRHDAYELALEAFHRKVESRPIDDEAWARELAYRAKLDAQDANPESFIVRVGQAPQQPWRTHQGCKG